MIAMN